MSSKDNPHAETVAAVDQVLSSKGRAEKFTSEEATFLVQRHRDVIDAHPVNPIDTALEPITRELALVKDAASSDAVSQVLRLVRLRQPLPIAGTAPTHTHLVTAIETPRPGCSAVVSTPPYSTGGPLIEHTGVDSIDIPDDIAVAATPPISIVEPTGKTFSALSLPAGGVVSLGVGVGTIRTIPTFRTVFPPSEEHVTNVSGLTWLLDLNRASATLLHFTNPIPHAPLELPTDLDVAVDVVIGDPAKPFYLVDPPDTGQPFLIQAFGRAHIVLTSSTGLVATENVLFLKHEEGINGPFGTPTVLRNFKLSQQLKLAIGTKWVSVGVEIRVTVQRSFILGISPTPEVNDRAGFAMIDLRSPLVPTQQVHPILQAGGPVGVSKIALTFCTEEVIGD